MAFIKDAACYICGPDNPLGLRVPFQRDGEAGSTAQYVARKEHCGWNGILHGGVTFSLMDEAFGWCLFFQEIHVVTARVETRFHAPVATGTRLHIRAWVVRQRRRLYDARAEVRVENAEGQLVAESDAVLYNVATTGNPIGSRLMTHSETEMTIREFRPEDAAAFRQLNEAWIKRYFAMEPKDEASLADPHRTILSGGGSIFMAVRDGGPVGCCALLALAQGEYEVAKMAVTESAQRGGIGRQLLAHTIAHARARGAHRLYLETNSKLAPAIRLYESLGFRHLPPERVVPSPYARANVYMELILHESAETVAFTAPAD